MAAAAAPGEATLLRRPPRPSGWLPPPPTSAPSHAYQWGDGRPALGAAAVTTVVVLAKRGRGAGRCPSRGQQLRCGAGPSAPFEQGEVDIVPPPTRWAGAGVGLDVYAAPHRDEASAVTLRRDMRIWEVIKTLLSSNALCVTSSDREVFYVKVTSSEGASGTQGTSTEDLCCILLEDLLEAPRQMPLSCLIASEESEECRLYGTLPEPYVSRNPLTELLGRLPWLIGLLVFLTVSSAILEYYDALLQRHLVIAFYLTALVGCGGNSGSQAASLVLQSLATGELAPSLEDLWRVLQKELLVALGIAAVLSIGVFGRIFLFGSSLGDAATISCAMCVMVIFSVLFGAASPLVLQRLGLDPAKVSGPLLSTVIDIVGVLVACVTAQLMEAVGILH